MAKVFHVPKKAVMKYIILPAKAPGLSRIFGAGKSTKASGNPKNDKGGTGR
jgi:hypothetical protein